MGEHSARSTARVGSPGKFEAQSDVELVELVRKGNTQAFAVLWQRHAEPGKAVARGYSTSQDPDDLVAEAFTKIFQSIQAGKGPTTAFRAYLFTTIRNVSASWGRSSKESSADELDDLVDPKTLEDESLAALDRSLTASAFRSLPTRWQEALWYSEVESLSVQQIAPLLGMKPNAVSALTFRAREGLRQAWIQAHISSAPEDSDCRWSIDRLGSHARGGLGSREQRRLDEHLAGCGRCSIIASEAQEVGSRLALILLPLTAGIGGAAAYTTWSQTHGASSLLAALTPGPLPASITSSFGATAAVSTGSSGATVAVAALVTVVALGGGAALVLPSLNDSAPQQHAAVQPVATVVTATPTPPVPTPAVSASPEASNVPTPDASAEPSPSSSPSPSDVPAPTPAPTVPAPQVPTPVPTTAPPPAPPALPPQAPTLISPASGGEISSDTIVLRGAVATNAAGNTIEVSTAAGDTFVGTVGADGAWEVSVGPLAAGTHTFSIVQRTPTGEVSPSASYVVTVT
ncbi:hypothetical protein GCM10022381_36630 [Leifsonia kafniensis]|uniref:Sigma-70 family RNA polymerase sigma factor n=1 Tax=Leifsonia kafniensis TaxID=475957 RepID=A0ABP7L1X0_9MICO